MAYIKTDIHTYYNYSGGLDFCYVQIIEIKELYEGDETQLG